jgi:uncharacterized protein (DUF1330 family)
MKTKYTVTLAMVSSFALGAAAVQVLHAQAKPPAYVITEVTVTNEEGFMKEFAPIAGKLTPEAGGKYLVRGGKTVSLSGAPPAPRVVVIQYESMDKALALFNSPSESEKAARAIGEKYATFRSYLVEGVSP